MPRGSSAATFDLNRLSTTLTSLEHSWWTRMVRFMAAGGNYISLVALLIFGVQFTVYVVSSFRSSWVWTRCLHWSKTLKDLQGVERSVKREDAELFLGSVPMTKVHDPNEDL